MPNSLASLSRSGFRDPGSNEMLKQVQHDKKTERTLDGTHSGRATRKEDEIWRELIRKVQMENVSLSGVLRGCKLSGYNEKQLVISAKYKFHKEKLEEKNALEILKRAIKNITGNDSLVSIVRE